MIRQSDKRAWQILTEAEVERVLVEARHYGNRAVSQVLKRDGVRVSPGMVAKIRRGVLPSYFLDENFKRRVREVAQTLPAATPNGIRKKACV